MLAIRSGRPETLTLRDFIEAFIRFREEVITRRSKFELFKARERAHILLGLVVAVTNLDEVVKLIRSSASPAVAREKLLERDWPMDEIRSYIALVEAVEPQKADKTYRLSEAQVRPSSSFAFTGSPRLAATRSATSSRVLRRTSVNCLKSWRTAFASTR